MRVSINHSEKQTGVFRKTTHYIVTVKVDFSEEEKAIIKQRDLKSTVIMTRSTPSHINTSIDDIWDLTISKLLSGPDDYGLETLAKAKDYEEVLIDSLKELKDYISANEEVEEKSKSFEL